MHRVPNNSNINQPHIASLLSFEVLWHSRYFHLVVRVRSLPRRHCHSKQRLFSEARNDKHHHSCQHLCFLPFITLITWLSILSSCKTDFFHLCQPAIWVQVIQLGGPQFGIYSAYGQLRSPSSTTFNIPELSSYIHWLWSRYLKMCGVLMGNPNHPSNAIPFFQPSYMP